MTSALRLGVALLKNLGDVLPSLVCRAVGAQFMADDKIAMLEFEQADEDITITAEKHYQLVSPDSIADSDLVKYRQRLLGNGR